MIHTPPHLRDSARWKNRRVGLLGGSFDPPHEGHVHASQCAYKTLKLDSVWWLVSPQNPLKNKAQSDFDKRLSMSQTLTRKYPHIQISDIERQLGTNLTWQTIRSIRHHFPYTDFVWISGLDNALTMHKWQNWRDILAQVATAHVARPPAWSLIEACPLKMLSTQKHHLVEKAALYPLRPHVSYWLMQKKLMDISSTQIRNAT